MLSHKKDVFLRAKSRVWAAEKQDEAYSNYCHTSSNDCRVHAWKAFRSFHYLHSLRGCRDFFPFWLFQMKSQCLHQQRFHHQKLYNAQGRKMGQVRDCPCAKHVTYGLRSIMYTKQDHKRRPTFHPLMRAKLTAATRSESVASSTLSPSSSTYCNRIILHDSKRESNWCAHF